MKVVVTGCVHGEIERIYSMVQEIERVQNVKVDLIICTGDFQAVRNQEDLYAMKVPDKYLEMGSFHHYYWGEKIAPYLTIFVGGNHEASNHLLELYYGGWVAPNIYYLGHSGVVQFQGLRIGSISGIYNSHSYNNETLVVPPYPQHRKASAYHIRQFDVAKLFQVRSPVDILVSHDWPTNAAKSGDTAGLLRRKKFFAQEVQEDRLGNPYLNLLSAHLRPAYHFASHLHVKFAALIQHPPSSQAQAPPATGAAQTRFLALDKVIDKQGRLQHCLQYLEVDTPAPERGLEYDAEWLAVIRATHPLLKLSARAGENTLALNTPSVTATQLDEQALADAKELIGPNMAIPKNFAIDDIPRYAPLPPLRQRGPRPTAPYRTSPQTTALLTRLGLAPFPSTVALSAPPRPASGFLVPRQLGRGPPRAAPPTEVPRKWRRVEERNAEEIDLEGGAPGSTEEVAVAHGSLANTEEIDLDAPPSVNAEEIDLAGNAEEIDLDAPAPPRREETDLDSSAPGLRPSNTEEISLSDDESPAPAPSKAAPPEPRHGVRPALCLPPPKAAASSSRPSLASLLPPPEAQSRSQSQSQSQPQARVASTTAPSFASLLSLSSEDVDVNGDGDEEGSAADLPTFAPSSSPPSSSSLFSTLSQARARAEPSVASRLPRYSAPQASRASHSQTAPAPAPRVPETRGQGQGGAASVQSLLARIPAPRPTPGPTPAPPTLGPKRGPASLLSMLPAPK